MADSDDSSGSFARDLAKWILGIAFILLSVAVFFGLFLGGVFVLFEVLAWIDRSVLARYVIDNPIASGLLYVVGFVLYFVGVHALISGDRYSNLKNTTTKYAPLSRKEW